MEVFLFAFTGVSLAFGAMALGVLLGRAPLERGCGRRGAADHACEACTRPCPRRRVPPAGDGS